MKLRTSDLNLNIMLGLTSLAKSIINLLLNVCV